MIEARELRIGNCLKNDGVVVRIDARSIFDIWDKSKNYDPIELTINWLRKFNFEFRPDKVSRMPKGRYYRVYIHQMCFYWFFDLNELQITIKQNLVIIKTVHHLQNFIFYTLNKELETLSK